ncbi:MAG: hypothetical protein MUE69_00690 [Myxococcota bacterium]|nr:hypothetical protein [Myxococcota bacterium]
MSDATLIAHLALLLLIPFTWYAFRERRPAVAALWVIFGSVLFLPEHAYFKIPTLPPFSKQSLPFLCVLAALWLTDPEIIRRARPFRGFDLIVLIPVFAGPFTALTNMDDLQFGVYERTYCQAMSIKDGWALGLSNLFLIWVPFFVGRALFSNGRDLRDLLKFLAWCGILYTPLMLYEVRFSPQLHRMVYGYMAHVDFLGTIRWGGYRPMVFMEHGLAAALFMYVAWASAVLLAREKAMIGRFKSTHVAPVLTVMLVMAKSTGVLAFALMTALPLWKSKPRPLLLGAVVAATLVMLYPVLRATDIFPTMDLYDFVRQKIDEDRAASILFRFINEDLLLEKARERAWFGWGYYGRNRVYDAMSGKDISVTDGYWIIILGVQGAVSTLAAFWTLLGPAYSAFRRLRAIPAADRLMVAGLALIVVVVTIDLIPNGLFSVYPYFLAGCLWGTLTGLTRTAAS